MDQKSTVEARRVRVSGYARVRRVGASVVVTQVKPYRRSRPKQEEPMPNETNDGPTWEAYLDPEAPDPWAGIPSHELSAAAFALRLLRVLTEHEQAGGLPETAVAMVRARCERVIRQGRVVTNDE